MNMIQYTANGGEHPHPFRAKLDEEIFKQTLARLNSPKFAKKGIKWIYNFSHFHLTYANKSPEFLKYLYEERPYPEQIEVENSTICPLKCKMCEHTYWKEKSINMSWEDFLKIMNQFPNLKQCGLTGIGEAWCNPHFDKMIDYCTERDIVVEIFDNFHLLTRERIEKLIDSSIYKVYCSLDAATPETYKIVREGSNWEKVMENLKLFDQIKKEKNVHFPELAFHFVVQKDNMHEAELYLDMLNDLDIEISFVQYSRVLHGYPEIKEDAFVPIPDGMKEKIQEKSTEVGIPASWNCNTAVTLPPMDQCSVWWQPFIFVDGNVTPCCSLNEQNDRPWQVEHGLGNMLKTPFRELWKKNREFTTERYNGKCPHTCDRCQIFNVEDQNE